jgi:threonyl-tRNA synthetase
MAEEQISLRKRDGSRTDGLPVSEFVAMVKQKIAERSKAL